MKIIKVVFRKNGLPHYFATQGLPIKKNDFVIIETNKGMQFGKATSDIIEIEDE